MEVKKGGEEVGRRERERELSDESMHNYVIRIRGGWGHAPPSLPGNLNLQIASDTIWDKLSKQHFDDTYLCPVTCI